MKITGKHLRNIIRQSILLESFNKRELEGLVMHHYYFGAQEHVQRYMDRIYKYDPDIDYEAELQKFADERPDGKKILASVMLDFFRKFKVPGGFVSSEFANNLGIHQISGYDLVIIPDYQMQTTYGIYFKPSLDMNLLHRNKPALIRLIEDGKVLICIFDGMQAMGRPTLADPEFLSVERASEKIEYLLDIFG